MEELQEAKTSNGSLKRRADRCSSCTSEEAPSDCENVDTNSTESPPSPRTSETIKSIPRKSSLKRNHESQENGGTSSKKPRRSISFSAVTAYYFPRKQGFTCVPSQGGSTLGMALKHSHYEQLSLQEHADQLKRNHKKMLTEIQRKRQDRLMKVALGAEEVESGGSDSSSESSEGQEESDVSDSEMDLDTYCFLQPVPLKQRKTLLEEAGVPAIENSEKEDCKEIRLSRETCGCSCEAYCDPQTCECARHDIKCQVDRQSFPCSCTKDSCGNPFGRVEFNPFRVRSHYVHTLMRLDLEAKQETDQNIRKVTDPHGSSSVMETIPSWDSHSQLEHVEVPTYSYAEQYWAPAAQPYPSCQMYPVQSSVTASQHDSTRIAQFHSNWHDNSTYVASEAYYLNPAQFHQDPASGMHLESSSGGYSYENDSSLVTCVGGGNSQEAQESGDEIASIIKETIITAV